MSLSVPQVDATPDTYIPVSTVGAILIAAMGPWITLYFAWYLDALGLMVDQLYELVTDVGVDDGTMPTAGTLDGDGNVLVGGYRPGYGALLDPTVCPTASLPFLAQFVGVQIPAGADDTTARQLIVEQPGLRRGTPAAILAAAKANLTGDQSVTLVERVAVDGSPRGYWFQLVIAKPSEMPDEQALIDAVNAVKPGGVMWTLVTPASLWTISAFEAAFATIADAEAAYATISDLEANTT